MLVHSLPMKSRKRLARGVFNIFATHSSLVHDATVVFSQFSNTLFTNRIRNPVKDYYMCIFCFTAVMGSAVLSSFFALCHL